MKVMLCLIALLAVAVTPGFSYPSRIPSSACVSMFPFHRVDAQIINPAPYRLQLTQIYYEPGSQAEITVTLTSDPNVVFKGVFVQARRLNNCSDTTPVGTFRLAASEGGLELMQCSGVNDSVRHKNSSLIPSMATKTFFWKPPASSMGPVYFRATVVQSKDVFWTTVTSDILKDSPTGAVPAPGTLKCPPQISVTPVLVSSTTSYRTQPSSSTETKPRQDPGNSTTSYSTQPSSSTETNPRQDPGSSASSVGARFLMMSSHFVVAFLLVKLSRDYV